MRPRLLAACIPILACFAAAQSQARLAEMRDGKLQLPFLKQVPWELDFTAAKARATAEGKLILAYFTRSYTRCEDSISLECGVLAEPDFASLCEKVVPFCHITTQVEGDKEQQLFAQVGGRVYPLVVLLDARGRVLYTVKGEKLPDFQRGLTELEALAELQRKAAGGDRDAPYALLCKQLELHHIAFPAAKKALKQMRRLSAAERDAIEPLLVEAEILHLAESAGTSIKDQAKIGERFFQMKKKGTQPTRDAIYPFWKLLLVYAEQRKQPDLYEEALDTLKQEFPDMKFPEEERTLRKLRAE